MATIFHSSIAPGVSIKQYIERIFKYSNCSPSCLVVAYVYMDKFKHLVIMLMIKPVHHPGKLFKSSLDQLYAQASRQWLQSQSQPVEKRKSKIIQWLQYRGFNWGVVNVVLKKLESEFPP